ncbi:hypothetical protein DRH29_05100, partial [candidate division Kazan bacterium]
MRLVKILLLLIIPLLFSLSFCQIPEDWWNLNWPYRIAINITNPLNEDLYDVPVKIVIDTASLISAGKMRSDCGDIKFVSNDYYVTTIFASDSCVEKNLKITCSEGTYECTSYFCSYDTPIDSLLKDFPHYIYYTLIINASKCGVDKILPTDSEIYYWSDIYMASTYEYAESLPTSVSVLDEEYPEGIFGLSLYTGAPYYMGSWKLFFSLKDAVDYLKISQTFRGHFDKDRNPHYFYWQPRVKALAKGLGYLKYYIEPGTCNTLNTVIWVRIPYLPSGATVTIYMYYGNKDASSQSTIYARYDYLYDDLIAPRFFGDTDDRALGSEYQPGIGYYYCSGYGLTSTKTKLSYSNDRTYNGESVWLCLYIPFHLRKYYKFYVKGYVSSDLSEVNDNEYSDIYFFVQSEGWKDIYKSYHVSIYTNFSLSFEEELGIDSTGNIYVESDDLGVSTSISPGTSRPIYHGVCLWYHGRGDYTYTEGDTYFEIRIDDFKAYFDWPQDPSINFGSEESIIAISSPENNKAIGEQHRIKASVPTTVTWVAFYYKPENETSWIFLYNDTTAEDGFYYDW